MARAGDRADQFGLPRRHPAEHEDCRARLVPSQQLEQAGDLLGHPGLEPLPFGPRDAGLERGDLKVLLEVDREVVGDHGPETCNARAESRRPRASDRGSKASR